MSIACSISYDIQFICISSCTESSTHSLINIFNQPNPIQSTSNYFSVSETQTQRTNFRFTFGQKSSTANSLLNSNFSHCTQANDISNEQFHGIVFFQYYSILKYCNFEHNSAYSQILTFNPQTGTADILETTNFIYNTVKSTSATHKFKVHTRINTS